jgi:hypothetical protein
MVGGAALKSVKSQITHTPFPGCVTLAKSLDLLSSSVLGILRKLSFILPVITYLMTVYRIPDPAGNIVMRTDPSSMEEADIS